MPVAEVIESPQRGHVFSPLVEVTSLVERLDLPGIFGRGAPLHVDLGCGNGEFLCAMAQQFPAKNFLGIERLLGRVHSAARKAAKVDNVRVLRMETSYAVRYLLPPVSVETFYLLFPDPWPKRRHQRRRVVNEDFLSAINAALIENGILRIATDQLDYFEQIKQLGQSHSGFAPLSGVDLANDLPRTKFEKEFIEQGAPIYRLALRKVSPVR